MKEIKLTQSKFALVDDEDFERVSKFKWYAMRTETSSYYARTNYNHKRIGMHQLIMNTIEKGRHVQVDHINNDTLDNRKLNLRICSAAQNMRNMKVHKDNKCGYKGVYYEKTKNKYISRICFNKKKYHIGEFNTSIEAAKAYNAKAIELHGEFARLNDI